MSAMTIKIGADIGGTTMAVAQVTDDGQILDRIEIPSPARESGFAVVRELKQIVSSRWPQATSVGIGAAGVIDAEGNILTASDSFRNWAGFALRAQVQCALEIPVGVENDVNAFLLGETLCGTVAGETDCLGVMLGTGVGGAIMLDGKILHGPRGAAAEIGHMPGFGSLPCTCGGSGHVETTSSGRSIARLYSQATGNKVTSAREVSQAAQQGDQIAVETLVNAGRYVALAIIQTATILDLDSVVVGGGVTRDWEYLSVGFADVIDQNPLVSGTQLVIHKSILGGDAVLIGAARKGAELC